MIKGSQKLKLVVFQTVFGIVLLLLWLKFVDLKSLSLAALKNNLTFLLLAFVFSIIASFLRTFRWKAILNPVARVPFFNLLILGYVQALFNYLIPIRAGDLGVPYLIKKEYKISFTKVLAATFLNRFFDLLATLFLAFLSLSFIVLSVKSFWPLLALISLVLAGVTFLFLAISFYDCKTKEFFAFISRKVPDFPFRTQTSFYLGEFLGGLKIIKRNRFLNLALAAVSLLAIMSDGVFLYFLFLSLNITVSFPLIFLSTTLFTLSFLIPAAPLYIGSTEVAGSVIFSLVLALNKPSAVNATVLWHLANSFLIITLGLLSLWLYRQRNFVSLFKN